MIGALEGRPRERGQGVKKQKIIYCLVVLAAFSLALLGIWKDIYSQTLTGVEFQTAHPHPFGSSLVAEELYIDPGPFAESEALELKAGSYRAILRYHALKAGSQLNILDDGGATLATRTLDPALGEDTVSFTLAHKGKVRVQLVYGGGSFTLHSVTLRRGGLYYTDHLLLALFALALGALGYRWLFGKRRAGEALADTALAQARLNRAAPVLLVVFVGVFASLNCFADAIPAGHDLEFHLVRIESIAEGWQAGQFPVRVHPVPMNGKGYLQGAMYPDLFLWPAALLWLLGVSLTGSYQFLLFLINVATGLIAYYAGKTLFQTKWNGAVAAVLYTLAWYRMYNLLERAALGEVLAMSFLPLLALGLYQIFFGDYKKWPLVAVAASGIIQSHVLSVLMAGLFSALFGLVFIRRLFGEKKRLLALFKALGITLLANAWFLVPFLYFSLGFSGTLGIIGASASLEGVSLPALLTGGLDPDGPPYGPGPALVAGAVFFLAVALFRRERLDETGRKALRVGGVCLGLAALALLLCSDLIPWAHMDRLPLVGRLLGSMQFPWRFLSIATLALVLCVVAALAALPPRRHRMQALVAILLCAAIPAGLIINQAAAKPQANTVSRSSEIEINNIYAGQYLYQGSDIMVLLESDIQIKNSDLGTEGLTITNYTKRGTSLAFSYQAQPGTGSLVLPLVWYAGYRAVDENGSRLAVSPQSDGLVQVALPGVQGSVRVWYAGEWFFRLGDAVSLATLALALLFMLRGRAKAFGGSGPFQRPQGAR